MAHEEENAGLIDNAMQLVGSWGGKAAKGAVDAANKMIDDEFNQKRLIFRITIKNHYDILNEETKSKHFSHGWKHFCWKYICCGLWTCRNCCCNKRCLCSCCFIISTDKGITKDIAGKLTLELTKDDVKHTINVLNDTDIEITLLHVSQSWLGKVKELAVENIAPVIVKQQIREILKKYGAQATISAEKREVEESVENQEEEIIKNDGQYL